MFFFITRMFTKQVLRKNSGLADGLLGKNLAERKPVQKKILSQAFSKKKKAVLLSPGYQPEVKLTDGTIHVTLTKNNTMLTLTDSKGDVVTWTSCQNCGFYGGQKTTRIATVTTAEEMGFRALDFEMKAVNVIFRGKPRLRQAVLRGLSRSQIKVQQFIIDPTIPYNGCRLQKKSRK